MGKTGFTLIELVMVIVLVAIAAVVASTMLFRGTNALTVAAMASKVKADIRYCRTLAMDGVNLDTPAVTNPTFLYRIRFNIPDSNCPGVNQYAIVNDADNNGVWGENPNAYGKVESARNPADGSPYFCVRMDSGDFSGFTVTADFGGSIPGVLEFDPSGVPYTSDHAKLSAAKTVTVSKGGESVTLTVTPNTGMVAVQ